MFPWTSTDLASTFLNEHHIVRKKKSQILEDMKIKSTENLSVFTFQEKYTLR